MAGFDGGGPAGGSTFDASATQTLTNKTIDASSNTISNITNTNISATAQIAYSKLQCDPTICGLRLTLTASTAIADAATATTMRLTPFTSGAIALYDGTNWNMYLTGEITLALGTLTSARNYDVFCYANAGTPTLEFSQAWNSDNITRTDALTTQNGVLCKSGATTRRYVGTFRTISTTQTTDSITQRFLWNNMNRVPRILTITDTTDSWTYPNPNNVWRQVRSQTGNKVEIVCGDVTPVQLRLAGVASVGASTAIVGYGVGVDSTTVNSAQLFNGFVGTQAAPHLSDYSAYSALGYHALNWLETGSPAAATITFFGDSGSAILLGGMMGTVMA